MFPILSIKDNQLNALEALNLSTAELLRLIEATKDKKANAIGQLKIRFEKEGNENVIRITRDNKFAVVSLRTLENLYHAKIAMTETKKVIPSALNVDDGIKYDSAQKYNIRTIEEYMYDFIVESILKDGSYTKKRVRDEKLGQFSEIHNFFKNFTIPIEILKEMEDLLNLDAELNSGDVSVESVFGPALCSLFGTGKCGTYSHFLPLHPEVKKMIDKGVKLAVVDIKMPNGDTHGFLATTDENYNINKNSVIMDLWEKNPTPRLMKHTDILNKEIQIKKINPEWIEKLQKVNMTMANLFENGAVNINKEKVNIKSYLLSIINNKDVKNSLYKDFIPSYKVNTVLSKNNNKEVDKMKIIALRRLLSAAMRTR